MKISTQKFDAVIVGAGGAGQRAALQLAQSGLKTAMVSKVFPTRSHTVAAQGGINAALGNATAVDDWRWHMFDTINGSDFLADQDAAEYMCREAIDTIYELEHFGLPFSRDEKGKIYQRPFGGQTLNYGGELAHRTCAAADRTGHALLHTLYQKNVEAKTVFYNEWYAIDLVKSKHGGIAGLIALCIETGEMVFLHAKATVLATGGGGQVFYTTTNAYTNTGDGMGMALRAGLPLQDMAMWQFHPTGIAGVGALITEASRGEGGYLLNSQGERYMERYAPHLKDLSCRDIVARASVQEIREGRGCGPNKDHVLLKLDHLGPEILAKRLPGISESAKIFAGVDVTKEPIPVVPTCHYMMGGIPTNIYGQVLTIDAQGKDQLVDGLFAAGECACVSVHGANRLGANSLLDIVVFGRAVGIFLEKAAKDGMELPAYDQDDLEKALSRVNRWDTATGGESVAALRSELQRTMQDHFGVFRDGPDMENGFKKLEKIAEKISHASLQDKSKVFNTARIEALELDNLMAIALATAVSAMNRKESRGAHSRIDFTERDDKNWLYHQLYFAKNYRTAKRPVNLKPRDIEPLIPKERAH